jgi:hypothetical protein
MSRVVREKSIPLGSPLYDRGLAQFRGNLDRLLRKYRAAGIPVFIGTLASNERDQPPFVSAPPAADGSSAAQRYEHARALDREGRYDEARTEYVAAKDRDELRFRAPQSFNALIGELAAAHGATLVDVHGAFAAAARNGIIGSDLVLEHVHPNAEGYFRLATAYYPAITTWLGTPQVAIDDATARREMPLTEIDRLRGEYSVAVLKNDWPFVAARQPVSIPAAANRIEEIAQERFVGRLSWNAAMKEALTEYQRANNYPEAARVATNLADAFVTSASAQYAAGQLLLRADEANRGIRYLQRAIGIDAGKVEYQLSLAQAQFVLGRPADSIATLEAILKQYPGESRAEYWLGEMRRRSPPR